MTHSILSNYGGVDLNSLNSVYSLGNHNSESFQPNLDSYSDYYDIDNLKSIPSLSTSFSIFSLNVQSIRAKIDTIRIFLSDLLSNDTIFDALCFQETWLDSNDDLNQFKLDGYKLIHRPKSCSGHGGLAIYIREHYTHDIFHMTSTETNWEGLFIKIPLQYTYLIIGNVYRQPDNHNIALNGFTDQFGELLNSLNQSNFQSVIAGDFNINLLQVHEKPLFHEFANSVVTHGFLPKITHPTRFTEHRGTLIDNLLCKLSPAFSKTIAGIMTNKISDHQGYFVTIDCLKKAKTPNNFITITKKVTDFNQKVCEHISDADLSNRICYENDLEENYQLFEGTLLTAIKANTESKRVKINKYKQKKTPWITLGLLKSIKSRDKLYRKTKQINPATPEYTLMKMTLSNYNTILKKLIRVAKASFYHSKFDQCKHDTKKTWQSINEVLMRGNPGANEQELPSQINLNGTTFTDNNSIANALNKHFSTVGLQISNSFQNSGVQQVNYNDYLNQNIETQFSFHPVTSSETEAVIHDLKSKPTTSGDGVSTSLIKAIQPVIVKPLTILFNQSISMCKFPDSLKVARVKALFKKGDKSEPNNYRPISILPSVSKVFEKLLLKQLYKYFTENSLLFSHQYGFRKGHSTEHAVLELVDRIVNNMDKGANPFSIFIDLTKAFDCLDHQILLDKLKYYGLNESAISLIKNYLTNRKQYISYNSSQSQSDFAAINIGVPQGSILGPFLFLVYMNDFNYSSNTFQMINYADDTTLLSTINTFSPNPSQTIEFELSKISSWLNANKMKINVSKTKALFYSPTQKFVRPPQLILNNEKIEIVDHFSYLGIIIDKNLSWKYHISTISRKISKVIGVLCRLKHFLPCSVLKTIYTALINCHLNYGILLWGGKAEPLFKLQKKAMRVITNSAPFSHTEPLFIDLKVLKVKDIYQLQQLKFAHKLFNFQLPTYFLNGFITLNQQYHTYNTRRGNRLSTPRFRHEYCRQFLRFKLIDTINTQPPCIFDKLFSHSLRGFSNYSQNYLMSKYSRICSNQNCFICSRQ